MKVRSTTFALGGYSFLTIESCDLTEAVTIMTRVSALAKTWSYLKIASNLYKISHLALHCGKIGVLVKIFKNWRFYKCLILDEIDALVIIVSPLIDSGDSTDSWSLVKQMLMDLAWNNHLPRGWTKIKYTGPNV